MRYADYRNVPSGVTLDARPQRRTIDLIREAARRLGTGCSVQTQVSGWFSLDSAGWTTVSPGVEYRQG